MNNYTPNYTAGAIPTGNDNFFGDMPDAFSGSGLDIANFFNFENPEDYAQYFQPIDMQGIQEGLAAIPDTRDFLFGQNQDWYTGEMRGLLGAMGRTGVAGSGDQNRMMQDLGTQFSSKMYGADREIQDLVQGYQDQLTQEQQGIYGMAQGLLAGGVEIDDGSSFDYYPGSTNYQNYSGSGPGPGGSGAISNSDNTNPSGCEPGDNACFQNYYGG